jgi:hypothetical protein
VGEFEITCEFDRESGFDDAAATALREWVFEPPLKDGAPVPVLVSMFMTVTCQA